MGVLMKLRIMYQTEVELLWRWRLGRRALLKRAVVSLLASIIAFYLTAWLLPDLLSLDDLGGSILAILLIAVLNLLVRPALLVLVASRSVVLLVILTLGFQTLVIWLLTPLIEGVTVGGGLLGAFVVSLILGGFKGATGLLFGLDEDDSYYGALVRSLASRRTDVIRTEEPGLVIIQTDGLPHDVLAHAIRAGRVPTLSRWVRSGSHKMARWEALLPPTTPASQAGILHGNNDGIPNFRWWEKESGRLLVANHPRDATVIESRMSNGEGLLSPGGASISNIFTGDAERAFLVQSTITVKERGLGQSNAFAYYFASPYNYLTMIASFVAEVIKEMVQSRRQRRAGVEPRLSRGMPYPFVRAGTNVGLRALGTSLLVEEMYRGTPVMYMDFTDYDEIAHHSGPERPESLDALDGIDRQIRILEKVARDAPRPYEFVVLADHGQTLGATFLQRYGLTLEDLVRSLMGGPSSVAAATAQVEDWGPLNAFLSEVSQTSGIAGSVTRSATASRRSDGQVALGPEDLTYEGTTKPAQGADASAGSSGDDHAQAQPDLVVVAGGNLAHIYFNVAPGRMSVEQIDERYPELTQALANHPGIGLLIMRSGERGLIGVGRDGIHYLDDDEVEGSDPLSVYGEYAATSVRRLDELDHVGDIAVISLYDPDTGEVAAFEELIGAHGGLGGEQTKPYILHPADWEPDLAPLVGAPMIYRQLRRWMEGELGMAFGPRQDTAGETGGEHDGDD